MGKKKLPKGAEVSFSDTKEGQSVELFTEHWYSLPFGKKTGPIDHEKLWWELHGASDQGYVYVNWMSAARTFYNNKPWIYRATTLQNKQLGNGQPNATTKATDLLTRSIEVAVTPSTGKFIFPEHLKPKHHHYGGDSER
jgi:hypothetical protein